LNLLKPKGYLAFISSNKYFRSAYGRKLRQLLKDSTTINNVIDFGDFPIFEGVDAYPSIIILSKVESNENQLQALKWDKVKEKNNCEIDKMLKTFGLTISQNNLYPDGWLLEEPQILNLFAKLQNVGRPLGEYINDKFYYGIKTGFDKAFVIDKMTRDALIAKHPSSSDIIKPILRGRDVKRWHVEFTEQYLIKIESSENKKHPWSDQTNEEAEEIFAEVYPAIHEYFSDTERKEKLINRSDQGRFFWELRSCIYWQEFEKTKIIYPDIYEHQSFTIDRLGFYLGNTCYFIPTDEIWLCGLLNSTIVEWFYSKVSNSIRGGYLRAFSDYMKQIPIPNTSKTQNTAIETLIGYVLYLTDIIKDLPSHPKTLDQSVVNKRMKNYFEQIINALVIELYLPEEIHEHNKYFMQYILEENLPNIDTITSDKMQILQEIFARIFDKEHPIRHNLFLLNTIPVVRIIEGKS
jgi:hypothetical protein